MSFKGIRFFYLFTIRHRTTPRASTTPPAISHTRLSVFFVIVKPSPAITSKTATYRTTFFIESISKKFLTTVQVDAARKRNTSLNAGIKIQTQVRRQMVKRIPNEILTIFISISYFYSLFYSQP